MQATPAGRGPNTLPQPFFLYFSAPSPARKGLSLWPGGNRGWGEADQAPPAPSLLLDPISFGLLGGDAHSGNCETPQPGGCRAPSALRPRAAPTAALTRCPTARPRGRFRNCSLAGDLVP
jgi:hypothetical protein